MEIYEKEFSDFLIPKSMKEELISVDYGTKSEYVRDLDMLFNSYDEFLFEHLYKFLWMRNKFRYDGARMDRMWNGKMADHAFRKFTNLIVKRDHGLVADTKYWIIMDYIIELYPDLPLKSINDKVKFPFKYVTLSHMLFVHKLEDRVKFIKYAEEHKMSYPRFVNFMVNNMMCHNTKIKDEYTIYEDYWKKRFMFIDKVRNYEK